jgi:hypothetical protein
MHIMLLSVYDSCILADRKPYFSYEHKWNYLYICIMRLFWHFESKESLGIVCVLFHAVQNLQFVLFAVKSRAAVTIRILWTVRCKK